MIPQRDSWVNMKGCTPEERRKLFQLRREALDAACGFTMSGEWISTQERFGWTAHLSILDRDRDGSIRARITVSGPGLPEPYVRNVRLVSGKGLPYGLGSM